MLQRHQQLRNISSLRLPASTMHIFRAQDLQRNAKQWSRGQKPKHVRDCRRRQRCCCLTTCFASCKAAFNAGLSVTRRSRLHQSMARSSFCSPGKGLTPFRTLSVIDSKRRQHLLCRVLASNWPRASHYRLNFLMTNVLVPRSPYGFI